MSALRPQPTLISLVLAGVFASAFAPGFAQVLPPSPPEALVLTEEDNGKTVAGVVDQPVAVNLRGNPTTGYSWMLASTNGDSVIPTGPATYTADSGGGAGVGGTFSFPFQVVKPGETTLADRQSSNHL